MSIKYLLTFGLLLGFALLTSVAYAATTDFVANGNITVSSVAGTGGTADLVIKDGSRAASWTYDPTANFYFKVTDPDATNTFKVVSLTSNQSGVSSIHVDNSSGVQVAC